MIGAGRRILDFRKGVEMVPLSSNIQKILNNFAFLMA